MKKIIKVCARNTKKIFLVVFALLLSEVIFAQKSSYQKLDLTGQWEFKSKDSSKWMSAQVPGVNHLDLLNNSVITDPFYRNNEENIQWIGKKDWVYKRKFIVDASLLESNRVNLNCDGLDTFAHIYINGYLLASTENMHRRYSFNIKNHLIEGENSIKIIFNSHVQKGLELYNASQYEIPAQPNDIPFLAELKDYKISPYVRKAGYHFGWDWGPRFMTSGIWRDIYIESWNTAKLNEIHLVQKEISKRKASINAKLEILVEKEKELSAEIYVNNELIQTTPLSITKNNTDYQIPFEINSPKLWWPNGMGKQHLYSVKIILKNEDQILSEKEERIGIREIRLVTKPDEFGESFYFEVNGHPFFAKGANYIPSDNFLPRVDKARYLQTIAEAKKSNFNMLRVWGGGIYESDLFYDLCDEYGILVWQDFMFACSMYPDNNMFIENIKNEAIDNVKRIRNHASLALWCGNNEVETAWRHWGWSKEYDKKNWIAYQKIFHEVLSKVVEEHNPEVRYWPSSPHSNSLDEDPRDIGRGDIHYWAYRGPRLPIDEFKKKKNIPRFMSETGFQSFPEFESVKKFSIPEDWELFSPVMKQHQKSKIGNALIADYIVRHFKAPKDFEAVIYQGQLMQEKSMRVAHEAYLRAKPYCMGALYWQINDCWPVASWSTIDYYGKWKAQQYTMKELFKPIVVSINNEGDDFTVYAISDKMKSTKGKLVSQIFKIDGTLIWENEQYVKLKPNESKLVVNTSIKKVLNGMSENEVYVRSYFVEKDKIVANNHYLFVPDKDIRLLKPQIKVKAEKVEKGYKLTFNTNTFSRKVFLSIPGIEGFFHTNYFDLSPDRDEIIFFETTENIKDIEAKIKRYSLADSSL